MTRHRSNFVRERTNLINRVHITLEGANIKLASLATDIICVSGRAILAAVIEGNCDPATMAELAKGRLRTKREELAKALEGRVHAHHRFILTELLCQIDSLDETLAHFDEQIASACRPFEERVAHLDTIPGVGRDTAEAILAEIGTDMRRFGNARRLSAWAGLAPGNHESGGQRRSSNARSWAIKSFCSLGPPRFELSHRCFQISNLSVVGSKGRGAPGADQANTTITSATACASMQSKTFRRCR